MAYNIIVALHIIAVVVWMSSLFYLPRLFVYHSITTDVLGYERFSLMEKRLYNIISLPGMLATWFFGLYAAWLGHWWIAHWFHAKMFLVVILSFYHGLCKRFMMLFRNGRNTYSERFYRLFNEIPTVILIAIVFLVKIKPSL